MGLIKSTLKGNSTFILIGIVILFLFPNVLLAANEAIQVNISPQGAIDDGAMWRYRPEASPTWSGWLNSGEVPETEVGINYIEYKDTNSSYWVKPNSTMVDVPPDQTAVINAIYKKSDPEYLQVNISPQEAVDDSAMWRYKDAKSTVWSSWKKSGKNIEVYKGTFNIKFLNPNSDKWINPGIKTITIAIGEDKVINVTYKKYEYLQVNISPQEAVNDGAMWHYKSIKHTAWSSWYNSGVNIKLYAGTFNLEFQDINSNKWIKPDTKTVIIGMGEDKVINAIYKKPDPAFLQVNISPQEAVNDGAMWRYKDANSTAWNSTWHNSGAKLEVYAGAVSIEFRDTNSDKWIKPDIITVTIVAGENKVIDAAYKSSNTNAKVTVIINPEDQRNNARWSLHYSFGGMFSSSGYLATGMKSGDTFEFVPMSGWSYYIEFNYIKDLAKPYDEEIHPVLGSEIDITGNYKELRVGNVGIYGNKLSWGGNDFKASGTTTWTFIYSWGVESVKYLKVLPDLSGTFSPARIEGNGKIEIILYDDGGAWVKFNEIMGKDNTFYNGKFTIDADTLESISNSNQKNVWNWMGMSYKVNDFEFYKSPSFGVRFSATGQINWPIFDEPSVLDYNEIVVMENHGDIQFTGNIIWRGATVADWMTIHETEVEIDTNTKTFTAEGFDVEVLQEMPSFRGSIRIEDGKLTKLAGELYDIGLAFEDCPIVFDNCGFNFKNPANKNATADFSAGVKFVIPKIDKEAGSDTWDGSLDFGGHLIVRGQRELFGYDIGSHETEVQWSGATQFFMSSFDTLTYVGGYLQFLLSGEGSLFVQWKPDFSFYGWIMGSGYIPLPEWLSWLTESGQINLASYYVAINTERMTLSAKLFGQFTLSIKIPAFWDLDKGNNQNMSSAESQEKLNKAAEFKTLSTSGVENFMISDGESGFILSLQGTGSAPDMILVMPDGTEIDPQNFSNNSNIIVGIDNSNRTTGFMVNNPQSGTWQVRVSNPDSITQRLIRGNRPPEIIPLTMEKQSGGSYKMAFEAYDADNNARITFYNSSSNTSFLGKEIGTVTETDGRGIFIWTPDENSVSWRYIYAVIEDGVNTQSRAYFSGHIINEGAPNSPNFTGMYMQGDSLMLKFEDFDTSIDSIKVYYSDDLEAEELTKQFATFATNPAELNTTPMVPGRRYQIRVTGYSKLNGESELSNSQIIDYRLTSGNNYPNITSHPIKKVAIGFRYVYFVIVDDYDNDMISYSILDAPKGMVIDENGTIIWKPEVKQSGRHLVTVNVDDGNGGTDTQKFWVDVRLEKDDIPIDKWNLYHTEGSSGNRLITVLNDFTFNNNPERIETVDVTIYEENTGTNWNVSLRETSVNSGQFKGMVILEDYESNLIKTYKNGLTIRYLDPEGKEQVSRSTRVLK